MREQISKHMVLFPFMAQGHTIPFLAFARLLERRRPQVISGVTLVTTPLNVPKLAASLPPDSAVAVAQLPFSGADHGLPPGVENTDSLTSEFQLPFYQATQSPAVRSAFRDLVSAVCEREKGRAVCIVSDFLLGWTVEVAERLGVFHSVFVPGGAYPFAMFFSCWFNLPHRSRNINKVNNYHEEEEEEEEECFTLPDFPEAGTYPYSRLPKYLTMSDETNPWTKLLQSLLGACLRSDGVLFNTVTELERIGPAYFARKMNRPVWTIGPIVAPAATRCTTHQYPCLQWLDRQAPNSVLYVSFGSMFTISTRQMTELAKGLEASGKPFVWAVRPPLELDSAPAEEDFDPGSCLPEGFESRMRETGRGLLVRKWAPQVEILAHESTGAFLSHCGWNSVVESLTRGVPIIAWPLSAEQHYTSKMLQEELHVSVEVAHGDDTEVDPGRVSSTIKAVLSSSSSSEGVEMRRRALGIKETLAAAVEEEDDDVGSSVRALNDFLSVSVTKTGMRRDGHAADAVPITLPFEDRIDRIEIGV